MVKVAVAGASSGIGRAIVEAIEGDGSHECIVLSRTTSDDAKVIAVDYSDIGKLKEILETHEIHTLISAVSVAEDASGQSQMNLIEAAEQSQCTERFMPSEFGAKYTEEIINDIPAYAWKFQAVDRLKHTSLEYTQFSNGMFMDYWFAPRIKSAFQLNIPCWVDLDNNFAAIPGDGNTPLVLTHSRDVGQFVVRVLGLPHWEKRYFLIGDRCTINDFVSMAEETKGVMFVKHYDNAESLQAGKCTLLPMMRNILPPEADSSMLMHQVALAGKRVTQGGMDLPTGSLNSLFTDMRPLTLKDAIQAYYSGK